MERVQYQQEEMIPELKDLIQKGLFSAKETKQILKKRTVYETALVGKATKKSDFLRYAAYEMGLEQLRRKRVERMKLPTHPATISDFAMVKRLFNIYERALKRFKSDIGLWTQYINTAKREGARNLVGRVLARALQLHANIPLFYILAASEELNNLSPSVARSLLQRGIRLNPDSIELWREHVRLELGFIESLRRRWDVLGVNMTSNDEDQAMATPTDSDVPSSADARKQVLNGAIVQSVIENACAAIPKAELFVALRDTINEHPSPAPLRTILLEHLHSLVPQFLPRDPRGIKLLATRHLTSTLEGEALVDAIQQANEQLSEQCGQNLESEEVLQVYADFVEEWVRKDTTDSALKDYLTACLASLTKRAGKSPSLSSSHLRCLSLHLPSPSNLEHTRTLIKKYTRRNPASSPVWLAALELEKLLGTSTETIASTWASARASASNEGRSEVWLWGLDLYPADDDSAFSERQKLHQALLRESMLDPILSPVHAQLLLSYASLIYARSTDRKSVV